jgi:type IV secretory pathway protease TraF
MARVVIRRVAALATIGLGLLAVKPLINPTPFVIWNASESVPLGMYFVSKHQPDLGEIAVIKPSDWVQLYASERGYLPQNVWLLKPIFAAHPSIICRFGSYIFADGKLVAKSRIHDQQRRLLPAWKGCKVLKPEEVFVIAKPRASFDSRYFGPVKRAQIVGTAIPLADIAK